MGKLTSIFLLCLINQVAFAGWSEIASDHIASEFVNVETIERNTTIAKMWNMSDFKAPQEVGNGRLYLSSKALQEYNCLEQTKRLVSLVHYADGMGKGQVVFMDNHPGEWKKIPQGSLGEVHLKAACKLESLN
jgi:hypothetical protein